MSNANQSPAEGADVLALAHRIAWRYKKSSDPHHSDTYTFNRDTLLQFAEAVRAANVQPKGTAGVDWLPHDNTLRFVQRVLEGDAPREDRDAAAQMVRDLRVSLRPVYAQSTAPAPEPVAMRYDFDGYGWKYIDNGSGSDWMTRHPDGELLYDGPCAAVVDGWRPIETAPKDGRKLILAYRNRSDKARTVMACWLTDEQAAETDGDDVGLEAGWYESIDNWPDCTQVAIHEGEPTHWMPLPAAPSFDVPVQGSE